MLITQFLMDKDAYNRMIKPPGQPFWHFDAEPDDPENHCYVVAYVDSMEALVTTWNPKYGATVSEELFYKFSEASGCPKPDWFTPPGGERMESLTKVVRVMQEDRSLKCFMIDGVADWYRIVWQDMDTDMCAIRALTPAERPLVEGR